MAGRPLTALLVFSTSRPRWTLGAVGLALVVAALGIPRLELRLDARSLIPRGHAAMAASDRASERFGQRDSLVVALSADGGDVYAPESLGLLARWSRELGRLPGIVPGSVVSLATVPRLFVEDGVVDLEPLLGDGPPSPALAERIRRETAALGLDDGVLVAADGRAAAIYGAVDPAADLRRLEREIARLLARPGTGDHHAFLSGSAMAQAVLGEAVARDLARLIPLVFAVVGLVLTLAFGSWRPALVALADAGISLVWTFGLMGWLGQPVFVTTLVLPVILVVLGVSDDVYALSRVRPGATPEELVATFRSVTWPVLFTSATTVAALLSLVVVGLEPQRLLGIFGAVAVTLSTLLTFSLVPALLRLLQPTGEGENAAGGWLHRARGWMGAVPVRAGSRPGHRTGPGVLAVLGLLAAGWTGSHLTVEDSWIANLPPDSYVASGDRAVNELLAGTNTLELMVDTGRPGGILEPATFEALGRLEAGLAASPLVGAVEGPAGQVVRVATALGGESYSDRLGELSQGRHTLTGGEIQQSLLLLRSLGRSPLPVRVDSEDRRAWLTVFVRSASFSRVAAVLELTRQAAGGGSAPLDVVPFGDGWIGYLTIRLLVAGQLLSIGLALVLEALLLTLLFRSLSLALWALLPVAASVLGVFVLLTVFGIPLGVASSMFAAVALGIGVDYSTHLVACCRQEAARGVSWQQATQVAMGLTGPAVLVSAVAFAGGFAVLLGSEILPNRHLGALISLSLLVCAVMTLVLVPTRIPKSVPGGRPGKTALVGAGLLLALLPAPSAAAAPPAAEPTAAELVAAYNRRDTGAPGVRRARLELRADGATTLTFSILQLWQEDEREVRSLFLLLSPPGLAGTSYLLVETVREADMEVRIHLPAGGRKVLEVRPSRFREGLLGSDFGYSEVTWKIPTGGRSFGLGGSATVEGRAAWVVEARPSVAAPSVDGPADGPSAWPLVRYYLRQEPPFFLGADYHAASPGQDARPDPEPTRRLRLQGWEERQGVWTPTVMVMTAREGRESVLTLEDARFHLPAFEAGLLTSQVLPDLAETLRQGTLPEPLRGLLP